MRVRTVIVLVTSAVCWSASARGAEFVEEPIPPLGEREKLVRVIDAATRWPIANARLRRYGEMTQPPAVFLGVFRTGADGVARVDAGDWDSDTHWIIDAPGFAPVHDYGVLPHHDEHELTLPRDVTLTVLDGLGRPAPGARVDAFDGCGHAPSWQIAVADAAGHATLEGIDPGDTLLWPEAEGLASEYLDLDDRVHLDGRTGRFAIVLAPGGVCEGVVEDGDGRPLQGVTVRVTGNDRGPSAVTGPDGAFRLVGGEEAGGLALWHPLSDQEAHLLTADAAWRSGHPLRIPLLRTGFAWEDAPARPLRVELLDDAGAAVPAEVTFVRQGDGRAFDLSLPQDEESEDELAPGRYAVMTASDAPDVVVRSEVEILAGDGTQHIALLARRMSRLVVEGTVPEGAEITLALPWREERLEAPADDDDDDPDDEEDDAVAIEPDAPAAVRVEWLGAAFFFEVGPELGGVRTAKIDVPRPHVLRIRTREGEAPQLDDVGFDDALALREDGHDVPAEIEDTVIRTFAAGGALVVNVHTGGQRHELWVVLPPGGGTERDVHLPTAEAAAERRVEVRLNAVDAAAGATVSAWDVWGENVLESSDYDAASPPTFLLAKRRRVPWRDQQVTVEVQRQGAPTQFLHVIRPGVVTPQWGDASLRLVVLAPDRTPADAEARLAGDTFGTDDDGAIEITGLHAGTFVLDVVPAEGPAAGLRLTVTLGAGEHAEHTIQLPSEE